jgi:hypothetical protein
MVFHFVNCPSSDRIDLSESGIDIQKKYLSRGIRWSFSPLFSIKHLKNIAAAQ